MNLRKHKTHNAADLLIDIAPLIDVVFILLIFFMVSTTFSRESAIEISLPEASQEAGEEQTSPLMVSIDAQGRYFVGEHKLPDDKLETLQKALQSELKKIKGGQEAPPVIINADAQAPHQSVIKVMDAGRRIGLNRLSFATQQSKKNNNMNSQSLPPRLFGNPSE